MKKMFFAFVVMAAAAASVQVFANSNENNCLTHNHDAIATGVAVQGKHCSGSVGCSCSGFSPITNGDVWQQAYCRNCGHKKSCHN